MTPRPNAEAMWESYMRRTGGDVMYQREASYRYQADVLYGAPSPANVPEPRLLGDLYPWGRSS